MRHAKCTGDLKLHLLGNQASVAIGLGWEGDLDQVIGLTDRGPMTVADALGPHLTPANFAVRGHEREAPASPKRVSAAKASPAAAPQSQE